MRVTVLDSAEDLKWLAETHTKLSNRCVVAVLFGNEDDPDKVELYARDDYRCRPTVLVRRGPEGKLVVEEWGEEVGGVPRDRH